MASSVLHKESNIIYKTTTNNVKQLYSNKDVKKKKTKKNYYTQMGDREKSLSQGL